MQHVDDQVSVKKWPTNQTISRAVINDRRYTLLACRYSWRGLILDNGHKERFSIVFDDVLSVEFPTFRESIGSDSMALKVLFYPIVNGQRCAMNAHLTFGCQEAAQMICNIFGEHLKSPLSPHFRIGTNRFNRRVLVILNPFSGQKKALQLWRTIVKPIFIASQLDHELVITEHEKHAEQLALALNLDDYDIVAVIGGDGTVLEVITGFLQRHDSMRALKMPIAHIPGGTSNGLAASVCFQCDEPYSKYETLCTAMSLMVVRPRFIPLRLCHVETQFDGVRPMFMSISWGLLADIDIGSERFRWAGVSRMYLEAFLRIMQLPNIAHYKAKISYIPIEDKKIKRSTMLRHNVHRNEFGTHHFDYASVKHLSDAEISADTPENLSDIFFSNNPSTKQNSSLMKPPSSEWVTIEGFYVLVTVVNISHVGSDFPYLPSARLDDDHMYLTFIDWSLVKSRFEVMKVLLSIEYSTHLLHPCLQNQLLKVIPVRACRVEPLESAGGFVAIDGEPITNGSAFQVSPSKYCATIVGRHQST